MKVITANALGSGEVVYWKDGEWVSFLDEARKLDDDEGCQKALAEAMEAEKRMEIVSPYWIEVVRVGEDDVPNKGVISHDVRGRWIPKRYREVIRAFGPSVHLHFGKQAQLSLMQEKKG
ncbi:MAG: DUF2849 domain-containing protein [Alphaproteobacteria bacterium GM7ARS4]|nr:DUF2849 domain-containing protein [Alphaproteobacteria bacterium GM7ARS4]